VATLYLYDTNGNPAFTITDTYGDGQPHFNGTNNITQTLSDVHHRLWNGGEPEPVLCLGD
jgi:hypothetical protein